MNGPTSHVTATVTATGVQLSSCGMVVSAPPMGAILGAWDVSGLSQSKALAVAAEGVVPGTGRSCIMMWPINSEEAVNKSSETAEGEGRWAGMNKVAQVVGQGCRGGRLKPAGTRGLGVTRFQDLDRET